MSHTHRRAPDRYTPDSRFATVAHSGPARQEWCPACKAWTLVCVTTYLLTSAGVTTGPSYALCEVCDHG